MTLYCGIDLHSNNSVISLIDETDQLISEERLDNNLEIISHHLQPLTASWSSRPTIVWSCGTLLWKKKGHLFF